MKGFSTVLTGMLVAAIVLGVVCTPAAAQNQDARIKKLEETLAAMQAELAALKAEKAAPPKVSQKQIDRMVSKAIEQNDAAVGVPGWVQNINLFGDLRYRHEQINDTNASEQRDRDRLRARIGLKAKINDEFDAIFRVATGSSDSPISTNQTLGDSSSDSFSSKEIWMDWAYFDWHPDSVAGLNVYGGKMKQPFYKVGKNELIWDGDVSPDGIAASYGFDIDAATTATLTGGGFWMRERSGDADSSFWGAQAMAKRNLDDGMHILGGATYYDIANIENQTVAGVGLNGNTADNDGSGAYEYDYNLVEAFGEFGFNVDDMPSAVYTSYIDNLSAPTNRNSAYTVGVRLNKVGSTPGTWQFGYNYREVESDAVFAGLSSGDFLLGGTGGKGHQFGLKYQLHKNVQGVLSYYLMERDNRATPSNDDNIHLFQTDLIIKF